MCPRIVVVLCHFLEPNGTLRKEFRERLDAAVGLWRGAPTETIIVVNGGQTKGTSRSQGKAAFGYLVSRGVSKDAIIWGEDGHDTLHEVTQAIEIHNDKGGTLVVISNGLHLWQVRIALWRLRVPFTPHPTPRHDRSIKYVVERLIVLPLTFINPRGDGWPFRALRFLRKKVLGQAV